MQDVMKGKIRKALDNAGYCETEADEKNLIDCFSDYVACGYWQNLEMEDIEDLTIVEMTNALIRM